MRKDKDNSLTKWFNSKNKTTISRKLQPKKVILLFNQSSLMKNNNKKKKNNKKIKVLSMKKKES